MFGALGRMLQMFWRVLTVIAMLAGLGTTGTYRRTAPYAQIYLAALATTAAAALVVVPLLLILKVASGWAVFAYLAAITAMIFTLALSLLWSPLGILIGMWQGHSTNPMEGGERYIRTVGIILFTETMLAMFFLFVPFHKNLGMVPLFMLAAAAVALSSAIWGGYLGAGFYRLVAVAVFLAVVTSFFLPQTFAVIGAKAEAADRHIARAISLPQYPVCANARDFRFTVTGPKKESVQISTRSDCWSGWIILPMDSTGVKGLYTWWGVDSPGKLEFALADGRRILLEADEASHGWLPPGHRFRLCGPGPVTVKIER